MAEGLAKNLFGDSGHTFNSAGTDPAVEVDPGAIRMLEEVGIDWEGAPKTLAEVATPDVVVTMGCDVKCPFIPGARTFNWEIPDPKGKEREDYLKVREMLEEKIARLINEELQEDLPGDQQPGD